MTFQPSLGTHFNHPVDRETLTQIRAFGFRWARIDAQGCDAATQHQMIADAQACDLVPLVIVYDLERLRTVPPGLVVEWGNEPDGDIFPSTYRTQLEAACEVAGATGVELWAPAISNLDRNSLFWMERVRAGAWPEGLVGITAHRYGNGTFDWAHDGFASRDEEVAALVKLCDGRPYMITEFGYPTDPAGGQRGRVVQRGLSEAEVAANIAQEWAFWQAQGCQVPFLYQINDGPGSDEKYGIRRCGPDGHPITNSWKPAAYQVPQASPPPPQTGAGMHIGIGDLPFPSETMRVAKALNAQGDGTYTISNLDETVMSVNPQGGVETRPAGTNGAWERCTRLGNVVYFNPIGEAVYPFAFAEGVPS